MEHMPEGQTVLMLFEHLADALDPCFVIPQLATFGCVPGPIRGDDGFQLQVWYTLEYLAGATHVVRDLVLCQIRHVFGTEHVIKLVWFGGLIGVVHRGIEEIGGSVAGFLYRGVAGDEDERKVLAHGASLS